MSDTRVGLVVDLVGDKEAMASLRNMLNAAEQLNKKKFSLGLDTADIQKKINMVQRHLNDLTKKKADIKIEGGDLTKVEKQIATTKKALADLKSDKADIRVNAQEVQLASGYLKDATKNAFSFREALSGIGGAMSSLGHTFQSIGNAFGGNMLSTIKTTLTAYGTLTATQGLRSSIGRYDTMTTFPKLMQQVGFTSEEAQGAVEKLNEAVLGLPTGLNEIVDNAKQYILAMNDIDKGTQLAIAANNAFLANASDASQTAFGMRQIMDILAKGELRSMEWQSLFTSLGTSLQPIAEYMGYSGEAINQFRTELREGAIDAMDFIDALIAVGTGTGELVSRVDIQKDTLNATLSNIKNAFSIIGYGVLDELNTLFKNYTGKSLPENIKGISDALKSNLKPALQGWIQDNGDRIMDFWNRLREFDWGKLASSIGGALDNLITAFAKIVDAIPEEMLTTLITFGTVYASPIGKGLSIIGGGLKMLSGISLHKLNGELTSMGKILEGFKGFATGAGGGVMGLFGAFGALLAGSSAYAHYKTDQRYTDAFGRTTGDYTPTSASDALSAYNDAKNRYAELERQYNALEKKQVYDAETNSYRTAYKNEEEAARVTIAMQEQKRIVDSLKTSYEDLSRAEGTVAETTGDVTEAMETSKNSVQDLKAYYDELKTSIRETVDAQINAFRELKLNKITSADLQGTTQENLNVTQQYEQALSTIREFQQKLSQEGSYTDAAGNVLTEEAFDRQVARILSENDMGMAMALAEGILGYSQDDMYNYLYETINNAENIDAIKNSITDMLAAATAEGEGIDVYEQGFQAGKSFAEGYKDGMTMQETLTGLAEEVGNAMSNVTGKIQEALFGGKGGMESTSKFKELYGDINTEPAREQLTLLSDTASQSMSTTTEAASGTSEAILTVGESSETASGQAQNLATSANSASSALRLAGSSAASATGAIASLAGAFSSVASQAFSAMSAVATLASAIMRLPTQKDIYINVHRNGSVNVPQGAEGFATGGVVYAANGRWINFVPRGTDTVPAMLTPGEFVVKRAATSKLLPVLERINNLDIPGAFDTMWSMLPSLTNRSVNNTTYNRDNHATVNNYNYGTSQEFSQLKSHRWAYGL